MQSDASPKLRFALLALVLATAAEAALTVGHFAYGADIYDDPSRYHVVIPALVALLVVTLLAGLFAWRPRPIVRWALILAVAVPFLGMFGLYHGAYGHGLKLLLFAAGTSPERLLAIFDSPDFAMPNDVAFEASGLSTFVASIVVSYFLVRVLRLTRHGRGAIKAAEIGSATASDPSR